MTKKEYYFLEYRACGTECPIHISGKINHSKVEWNIFETKPNDVVISKNYEFTITDRQIKSLEFDFYGPETKFVSAKFLDVCNELEVKFRALPLKFILRKKEAEKDFFIFLPVDHLPLLDTKLSEFTEARNVESGELIENKIYPAQAIYNNITRFVTSGAEFPHLFKCSEILELVCTQEFMQLAIERGLCCIDFIPIDANFKYDAWAD